MLQVERTYPDICNMMTMRYDPYKKEQYLKNIEYNSIRNRTLPYPSYEDIELSLRSIIRNQITSLNPKNISLALSSGVDSNLVLSLIRDEFPDLTINCITVTFDEFSEAKDSKKIAENNSSNFHEVIVDNPLRELPRLVEIVGEPRWNLYQYYFIKKSNNLSKIIFTGDGGDELFGGYSFRYKKFLDNYSQNLNWLEKVNLYFNCHERDWVPDQDKIFSSSMRFNWTKIHSLFKRYFDNDLDPLDQVFMADYHGKLMYDFVPSQSKFFDHFNLIGIAPILDSSIREISVNMPSSLKYDYNTNTGKIPLRKIVSKFDNISRNKLGFSLDLENLWKRAGKEIVVTNLEKGSIFKNKIINKDFIIKALKHIEDTFDVRYINKMFQILSLEIWYKIFVTKEMNSKQVL